jgi:hypothetical protein
VRQSAERLGEATRCGNQRRDKGKRQGELFQVKTSHGSEAITPTPAEPDARATGQPCTSLSDNSRPATQPATMHGLLPPDLIRQLVTFAATYSIPIDELREYTLEAFTAGIRYVVTDQREWDVWPEVG